MNASTSKSFARREIKAYQRLHRRYELATQHTCIAGSTRRIYAISNPDTIIEQSLRSDERRNETSIRPSELPSDEEPYWMQHWPSAHFLEAELDRLFIEFKLLDPTAIRILELGCGGGVLSMGLALRHCNVLATDYSTKALLLTRLNGYANGIEIKTQRLDWRTCTFNRPFDVVVAADVAYDRCVFPALNDCLMRAMIQGGVAILAEPYRSMGDDFIEFLLHCGWFVQIREARGIASLHPRSRCRFIVVRHCQSSA